MIQLTERAAHEVRRIVAEQKLPDATALRVGVKGGGCSGFSYTLGFDDQVSETDQVYEVDGVRVVCDPKSFLYLNGTQIDFEDNLMGRGFKFGNPNAAKSCGCGESFSV
ncbi:MAG: iron-sulfur cluster assembly accessory protein [Planctomycetes bacterium]|nr:iron-sulfur cluster assembly accessory protein [Planctomycetota bacterium]